MNLTENIKNSENSKTVFHDKRSTTTNRQRSKFSQTSIFLGIFFLIVGIFVFIYSVYALVFNGIATDTSGNLKRFFWFSRSNTYSLLAMYAPFTILMQKIVPSSHTIPSPAARLVPTVKFGPTTIPTPTSAFPTPTQLIAGRTGDPYSLTVSGDWTPIPSLWSNGCNAIQIRHYHAPGVSFNDFHKNRYGFEFNSIEDQYPEIYQEINVNFQNISPRDLYIVGATGEGEINNLFIRDSSGFYEINVVVVDPFAQCKSGVSYKDILSTFTFTKK